MPDELAVRVRGHYRGHRLDGQAMLTLLDDALAFMGDGREARIRDDRLDGTLWEPPQLLVHLAGGDVLEISGDERLAAVAEALSRRVLVFPELTRTLHGLGSRRGRPGSDHDRFFGALLEARRRAEVADRLEARLAAFDAAALRTRLERTLGEMSAERFPESPPDRRALEAELQERAERLLAALDALGDAARGVRASDPARRFAAWREWTRAAARVFEEADRCWLESLPALVAPPERRRRFWRRILPAMATLCALLPTTLVVAT